LENPHGSQLEIGLNKFSGSQTISAVEYPLGSQVSTGLNNFLLARINEAGFNHPPARNASLGFTHRLALNSTTRFQLYILLPLGLLELPLKLF